MMVREKGPKRKERREGSQTGKESEDGNSKLEWCYMLRYETG